MKKKKNEILKLEGLLAERHAIRNFPLSSLGHEARNCGGPSGRKRRLEVLDRLVSLGNGLSPAQKNDWSWFQRAWDERMVEEHGDDWPMRFSSWVQKTIDDIDAGDGNALSVFVNSETIRCFSDEPAISVPGAA